MFFFIFIQVVHNYPEKVLLAMHVHTCAMRAIGRYTSQHLKTNIFQFMKDTLYFIYMCVYNTHARLTPQEIYVVRFVVLSML